MDILFYILAFIYIYNVPFVNIPISGSKIVVILLFFWTLLQGKIIMKKNLFRPIVWILLLLLYCIFNVIFQYTSDYSLVYSCILFIFNHFIGGFLFATILKSYNRLNIDYVLKLIISIAVVQSIIICLMMFSDTIFSFISQISPIKTRESIYMRYDGARGYGMASSITYDLAVVQSLSLIFIVYLFPRIKGFNKILYISLYILIVISILVTGRTGLVGVILSILFMLFIYKVNIKRVITVLFIVCFGIGITFYIFRKSDIFTSMGNYVFEAFINFKETGSFSTSTSSNIEKMFETFKSISIKTFILGDARYKGNGGYYYGNVDVGFFRHIYYFGIIGTIFLLMAYRRIYVSIIRKTQNKSFILLLKLLFIYFIVAHIKGDFLLGCGMAISVLLLIYFTIMLGDSDYRKFNKYIYLE